MKPGTWYVSGFVIAFIYFYVYAVNYIRGIRGEELGGENVISKDLKHLPEFLEQFKSSSREGRDAEALWPLTFRSGPPKPQAQAHKLRGRNRPAQVTLLMFGYINKKYSHYIFY